MKILILGSTGMLGHVVKKYFEQAGYKVYASTRDKNSKLYFDVNDDIKRLDKIIQTVKPDAVINCIGILNKACDENPSLAVLANSYLPYYIDDLSRIYDFKFVHISTDCVFDGKKGNYSEFSDKDAYSFYGKTKGLGEIVNDRNVTLRTSIIGPDENPNSIGLFSWFMKQEDKVNGYSNVIWTGVTTIELAKHIEDAITNDLIGLYHVVNGQQIDKYSLLCLFKKYFKPSINVCEDSSVISNKSLIVTRTDYKFNVLGYEEMLQEMRQWVEDNKDLYPNLIRKMK